MARKVRSRAWTPTDVRELKSLAKLKTPANKIARSLKRHSEQQGKKLSRWAYP